MDFLSHIPKDLVDFILVVLFALLFGMEQRKHHTERETQAVFGTDRTFTLIGILGFLLFYLDKKNLTIFIAGGVVLALLFVVFYFQKIKIYGRFGVTSIIVGLITYSLAPLIELAPPWLTMSIVVVILILVESKEELQQLSSKFDKDEFTTLAKFIIIAGIILPLLPNKPIFKGINITPYSFWLAIVAVSGISYFSYLLKKFVFPRASILLTAILGGMYSSTATTVILAKKSEKEDPNEISAGIIAATGVMYLRIWLLALIFNNKVAVKLLPYFSFMMFLSFFVAYLFYRRKQNSHKDFEVEVDKNPLEFKTALIFGALFTFFALLSQFVMDNYGDLGMTILSLIVGVTDIDPYLLSIFQSGGSLAVNLIVLATILATTSNSIAKMSYALILGDKKIRHNVTIGFSVLIFSGFVLAGISWFLK